VIERWPRSVGRNSCVKQRLPEWGREVETGEAEKPQAPGSVQADSAALGLHLALN